MSGNGVTLANAWVQLKPSFDGAQGEIAKEFANEGKNAGTQMGGGITGSLGKALLPVAGILAGVFSAKAIVGWGKEQIAALSRIEEINAQTASAIKATGGAAGVSAAHVESLAGKLEDLTATEAESIQQGANLLLTFKNIKNEAGAGNDVFDQSVVALTDMARAMGQDPASAAVQLGKALNDPVAGISALSRVGIQFTDDQKALIQSLVDSGQTMEAQKIILGELNSQFGGSGAAYADTYAGKITLLGHAWGTFGEQVFSVVMPALGGIASSLTGLLNGTLTPFVAKVQEVGGAIIGAFSGNPIPGDLLPPSMISGLNVFMGVLQSVWSSLGGAVGPLLELWQAFSPLSLILQVITPLLPQLGMMFAQLAESVGGALSGALVAVAAALTPVAEALTGHLTSSLELILPILGQLVSMLGGILAETITALVPVVVQIAGALGTVLGQALTAISPMLQMLAQLAGSLLMALMPLVQPILDLVMALLPLLTPIIELVGALLTPLIGLLTALLAPIIALIEPLVSGLAGALGVVITIVAEVLSFIVQLISAFVSLLAGSDDAGSKFQAIWSGVQSFVGGLWDSIVALFGNGVQSAVDFVLGLPGKLMAGLSAAGTWLLDVGKNIVQGLIDGVSGMIDNAVSAVTDIGGAMLDGVKSFLGIHSPSRVFEQQVGLQIGAGIVSGLGKSESMIDAAIRAAVMIPTVVASQVRSDARYSLTAIGSAATPAAAAPAPTVIQYIDMPHDDPEYVQRVAAREYVGAMAGVPGAEA